MNAEEKKAAEKLAAEKGEADKKAAEPAKLAGSQEAETASLQKALDEDNGVEQEDPIGTPVGAPVECIVKKKFFDENSALVPVGKTYYYQRRKGKAFPYDVLEPVNKSHASAAKREFLDRREEKEDLLRNKRKRRAAFARLAADTEY